MNLKGQKIKKNSIKESEHSIQLIRRYSEIDRLVKNILPNTYPCDFEDEDKYLIGFITEIPWYKYETELEDIKTNEIRDFILRFKKDDIIEYYRNECNKKINEQILKEQTEEVLELPTINFFFNDWNVVIKYVKEEGNPLFSMQGNLDLQDVCPETLGRLYSVEGDLDLYKCKNLTSLGKLSHVGGSLDLRGTNVSSLGSLQHVGEYLDLYGCKNLTSLGELTHVGGYLDLFQCRNLISLGNLTHVKRGLDLRGTNITSLGNLQHVGGYLDLYECKNLTSLGNLTHVGEYLDLRGTKVTSLGNLTHVGGDLYLKRTPIANEYSEEEIRKMVNVEGDIELR